MRTIAFLLAVGLVAYPREGKQEAPEKHDLKYKGKEGDTYEANFDYTVELKVKGDETSLEQARSAVAFLRFEKVHIKGTVVRSVTREFEGDRAGRIQVQYKEARFTGVYDGEKFDYSFTRGKQPQGLQGAGQYIYWFWFMPATTYRLEQDGRCEFSGQNQDATGEVMGLVTQGIIRLPRDPAVAKQEWKQVFKTANKQRQTGGRYEVTQTSKLDGVVDGMAIVSTTLGGKLVFPEKAEAGSEESEEASFEGSVETVFDVAKGQTIYSESSGEYKSRNKWNDNEGNEHSIDTVMKAKNKISPLEKE